MSRLHGFVCTTRDATDTEYSNNGLTPATKNRLKENRHKPGPMWLVVCMFKFQDSLDSRPVHTWGPSHQPNKQANKQRRSVSGVYKWLVASLNSLLSHSNLNHQAHLYLIRWDLPVSSSQSLGATENPMFTSTASGTQLRLVCIGYDESGYFLNSNRLFSSVFDMMRSGWLSSLPS